MQTLYGVKVTGRVTVEEKPSTLQPGAVHYLAYLDGEHVATELSGRVAVNAAIAWLKERAKQREIDAERAEQNAAEQQRQDDLVRLEYIAADLGVRSGVLEELFAIFARRSKDQ